jgi:hypothetical protein
MDTSLLLCTRKSFAGATERGSEDPLVPAYDTPGEAIG